MKLTRRFSQGISVLDIEGIPDNSLNHSPNTVGILLSWQIDLIGLTVLEGKKDHLINLVNVIRRYSKYCISGNKQTVGDFSESITITPYLEGHKLKLVSSKEGVEPLQIILDDAELADLTKCLDQLCNDKSVAIDWEPSSFKFFTNRGIDRKWPNLKVLIHPLLGATMVLSTSLLLFIFSNTMEERLLEENRSIISNTIEGRS